MDCTTYGPVLTAREIAAAQIPDLYQILTTVTDGRCARGRRYGAAPVLTAMMVAKMAGEEAWSGIAQWVSLRLEWLQQVIPLPKAPCANCYRYLCERIDAGELNAKVADFFAGPQRDDEVTTVTVEATIVEGGAGEVCDAGCALDSPAPKLAGLRHLACDGKELRGTHRFVCGNRQVAQGTFAVYDVSHRYTQALLPLEGKGMEQAVFRAWLRSAELQGCVVTADALHTQTVVCRTIRRRGGEYVLIAKRNQRALHEDIGFLFSQPPDYWFPQAEATCVDSGHGRLEVRTLRTSRELNAYLGDRWPDVQQVFCLQRTITRRGTKTIEVVYGLTSLSPQMASPAQLMALLRAHWQVENRNHWRRDATLGEDRTQTASKPAALTVAALNNTILALLDRHGFANLRSAMRIFAAYPERALALIRSSA